MSRRLIRQFTLTLCAVAAGFLALGAVGGQEAGSLDVSSPWSWAWVVPGALALVAWLGGER